VTYQVLHGDCRDVMAQMESESVDAIVTDPPAGIAFMGRAWDSNLGGRDQWIAWLAVIMREALRVAKPGAHALVWALPRTSGWTHRALEDAGWEIRDCITHLTGQGFPKSHNLTGDWQGWGTALKPAAEFWYLARKPLTGTVAANVLAHGTGAIHVDACRIGSSGGTAKGTFPNGPSSGVYGDGLNSACEIVDLNKGRWPSNVCLDEVAADQMGDVSRYFYTAKASRSERNAGLEGMPERESGAPMNSRCSMCGRLKLDYERSQCKCDVHIPTHRVSRAGVQNHHPTVKPLSLMQWLVRLITPPNGVVLDPFAGSGSTGCAAVLESFRFIGIEREAEYVEIAEKRIAHWAGQVRQPDLIGGAA